MKVAELRSLLEPYTEEQLRYVITELYKAIPKAIKEDKDIDGILSTPDKPARSIATREKASKLIDMETLREETEQFIEYAYNQYYLAPNRTVPKQQRAKWRFIAKRLYKDLLASAANKEHLPLSLKLLTRLYEMLCYSCGHILFTAYDTFESVGIEQTEFFHSVLMLKHRHEPLNDFVRQSILLVVDNYLNRYTLYSELMYIVLEFLPTPDAKELAAQICDEILRESKTIPQKSKKEVSDYSDYGRKRRNNNIVEMTFLCCGQLHEFERAIRYFQDHYIQDSPEIKLYVLLRLLFSFQRMDFFVQEYKNAVKRGVTPREQLASVYQTIQKTGNFPEIFR